MWTLFNFSLIYGCAAGFEQFDDLQPTQRVIVLRSTPVVSPSVP
jgi:hypothetical protein